MKIGRDSSYDPSFKDVFYDLKGSKREYNPYLNIMIDICADMSPNNKDNNVHYRMQPDVKRINCVRNHIVHSGTIVTKGNINKNYNEQIVCLSERELFDRTKELLMYVMEVMFNLVIDNFVVSESENVHIIESIK